jgi:hypothetical protein
VTIITARRDSSAHCLGPGKFFVSRAFTKYTSNQPPSKMSYIALTFLVLEGNVLFAPRDSPSGEKLRLALSMSIAACRYA